MTLCPFTDAHCRRRAVPAANDTQDFPVVFSFAATCRCCQCRVFGCCDAFNCFRSSFAQRRSLHLREVASQNHAPNIRPHRCVQQGLPSMVVGHRPKLPVLVAMRMPQRYAVLNVLQRVPLAALRCQQSHRRKLRRARRSNSSAAGAAPSAAALVLPGK